MAEELLKETEYEYVQGGANKPVENIGPNMSMKSAELMETLGQFQNKMNEMESLVDEIKAATRNIKASWRGKTGEETIGKIESYQEVFDEIDKQNQKYVEFINTTIDNYKANENARNYHLDHNSSNFGAMYNDSEMSGNLTDNGSNI
jgi:uncharacterized protein YukE